MARGLLLRSEDRVCPCAVQIAVLSNSAPSLSPCCYCLAAKPHMVNSYLTFHDDLTTLPAGVFSGLDNVVDMDMSYTGLQYLPAGVFSGMSALKKL